MRQNHPRHCPKFLMISTRPLDQLHSLWVDGRLSLQITLKWSWGMWNWGKITMSWILPRQSSCVVRTPTVCAPFLAPPTMLSLKMSRPWINCLTRRTRKWGRLKDTSTHFENLTASSAVTALNNIADWLKIKSSIMKWLNLALGWMENSVLNCMTSQSILLQNCVVESTGKFTILSKEIEVPSVASPSRIELSMMFMYEIAHGLLAGLCLQTPWHLIQRKWTFFRW